LRKPFVEVFKSNYSFLFRNFIVPFYNIIKELKQKRCTPI
jgi:hypothetical protein